MATRLELISHLTGAPACLIDELLTHVTHETRLFAACGFESLAQRRTFLPPTFFSLYPLLFEPVFPELEPNVIKRIAIGSHFLSYWCFVTDHVADREPDAHIGQPLMLGPLLSRAQSAFWAVFPELDSPFWGHFAEAQRDFTSAVLDEESQSLQVPWAWSQVYASAAGRAGCAKVVPVAMALACGQQGLIPGLCRSHDWFAIGRQLLDDLEDWQEDLERNRASVALQQAFQHVQSSEREQLGGAIAGPVGRDVRQRALQAFGKARYEVAGLPDCGWKRWISRFEQETNEALGPWT